MGTVFVVVADVDAQYLFELTAGEDQDAVEAFVAHGSNPTFGDGVGVGGPYRGADDLDAFAAKDGIEARRELGVAVSDQEPDLAAVIGECHAHVAGVLGDPRPIRVGGQPGEMNDA